MSSYVLKYEGHYVKLMEDNLPILCDRGEATVFHDEEQAKKIAQGIECVLANIRTASVWVEVVPISLVRSVKVRKTIDEDGNIELTEINTDTVPGDEHRISGIDWLVVNRQESSNAVNLTFCSKYALYNYVPFMIPRLQVRKSTFCLGVSPIRYERSYVAELCIFLASDLAESLCVRENDIERLFDRETGDWVHLLTVNQLKCQYSYFANKEHYKCKELPGIIDQSYVDYWLATLDNDPGYAKYMNACGEFDYDFIHAPKGFRPCFTIQIPPIKA